MDRIARKEKFRIAVVRPGGPVAPFIMDSLAAAFNSLGHTVEVFDKAPAHKRMTLDQLACECLTFAERCISFKTDFLVAHGLSFFMPINAPDVAGLRDWFLFPPEAESHYGCNTHLVAAYKIPSVFCFFDDPAPKLHDLAAIKRSPKLWLGVSDENRRAALEELTFDNTFNLPTAPVSEIHSAKEQSPPEKFASDVCFVGAPSEKRSALLQALSQKFNLAIYGPETWKEYSGLTASHRGSALYPDDAANAYRGAKIVIDIPIADGVAEISQRVFDAASCGAAIICEAAPHIKSYFEPGVEIESFNGAEELIAAVEALLSSDEKRKSIGAAAQNRVAAQHTWERRAATIIDFISG